MWPLNFLLLVVPVVVGKLDYADLFGKPDEGFLTDLYSRDLEPVPGPIAWGHKYMGGGAGEGKQFLSPSGFFENKEQVKTDAILPAYCEPPNPCPVGFTASDGCLENFENTAAFSREYQAGQSCLCDEEHMFSCPPGHSKPVDSANDDTIDFSEALDQLLQKAKVDQHKTLVAKKYHDKRGTKSLSFAYKTACVPSAADACS